MLFKGCFYNPICLTFKLKFSCVPYFGILLLQDSFLVRYISLNKPINSYSRFLYAILNLYFTYKILVDHNLVRSYTSHSVFHFFIDFNVSKF